MRAQKAWSCRQLFPHRFHDVVRHERLAIVLADMAVGDEAGFAAQVAGKLAAVVVLDDDRVPGIFEDVDNRIAMQRHQPADLELIGGDALLRQDFAGLLDDAVGGAPADQRDIGVRGPFSTGGGTAASMPAPCACAFPSWRGALSGW